MDTESIPKPPDKKIDPKYILPIGKNTRYVYWMGEKYNRVGYVVVRDRWGSWFHRPSKFRSDLVEIQTNGEIIRIITPYRINKWEMEAAKYFEIEEVITR